MKILIFGFEETSKMLARYIEKESESEFAGFFMEDEHTNADSDSDPKVLPYETALDKLTSGRHYKALVPISGGPLSFGRKRVFNRLKSNKVSFANFLSPHAYIDPKSIGENNVVLENNVFQNGVVIGDNNLFWSGNHIGHSSSIGSHNYFTSHVVVSGRVSIEDNCFFGVNSTVTDGISIGSNSFVTAGSLVARTLETGSYVKPQPSEVHSMSTLERFGIEIED